MTFAWPHLLWLLVLPAALLVWEWRRRRTVTAQSTHPKILRAEIASHELAIVRDSGKAGNARLRPWLAAGLAFTIVALARPQWGRIDEPVFDQSREILLAIDLSRSMMATDIKPSRLDRAKLLVQSLLEKLQGERIGLVVFSGTAFLQSPLSADYEILREFLPSLNTDFLPEGGTNYRALIDTSLDAFGGGGAADRFLIILSDGEATDDSWRSGVDELKKKSVRVIGLGLGTATGSMIPDGSGGFVKDERGAVVLSKLESGTLKELADATHGAYRDASAWVDLAGLINQTVNEGRKGRFLDKKTIRYVERFQWPLALALWCFLLSFCYEFPVQPRAREISLRAGGPSRSGAGTAAKSAGAALLLACIIGAFSPAPLHAAVKVEAPPASAATAAPPGAATPPPAQAAPEEAPPPGTPASLGRIVGRLAQQDTLSAPDLSELAHETVNWGRRIKEAGQPVPAGPVKDALAAVDELERRGDKLADWSQLRKELQALLERPPEKQEQKSPPQNQQQKNDDSQKKDQQSRKPEQQNQNQAQKPSANQDKAGSPQDRQDQKQSSNDQAKESSQSKSDQNQPNASPRDAKKKSDQPFAFGDMKKSPPPPPASSGTQKVGGADEKKGPRENADPALALPLQKLQEVRNHDSPGRLFQIMQAESNARSQKKPAKDW